MHDEYESVKDVLRGMGRSPTAGEVSRAMASLGLPIKNVEELLNRAVIESPDEFLRTSYGNIYRYQYRTQARLRASQGPGGNVETHK
jgi:hypothetical protein